MNDSSKINSSKPDSTLKANDIPDQLKNVQHGRIPSKISCKIGGHLGYACINTDSSVSIASSDLYQKLLRDNCSFKEQNVALHLVDDIAERHNYNSCITSTTVSAIGETKSINLLAFPNVHIEQTTLGMDFLSPKLKTNPLPPVKFAPNTIQTRNNIDLESIDQSIQYFDSFLNIPNLKSPLHDVLTHAIATDKDVQTVCTYMKEHSRLLSPIRDLPELAINPL